MGRAEPGRVLAARYRLRAVIRGDEAGDVWLANDGLLHRDVVLRAIPWAPPTEAGDREDWRARAHREANALSQLSHPNITGVLGIAEDEGQPWMVFQAAPYRFPNRPLSDVVADDGPLRPEQAAMVGRQVLAAIREAHAVGVLHRDIKPASVLLGAGNRVMLADFGLVTADGSPALSMPAALTGTPWYMAPERARGEPATPAADLWSLGAVLYAAVEGRAPFGRESSVAVVTAITTGYPDPPRRAGPLWPVISGLLRKDPAARPDPAGVDWLLWRVAAGRYPARRPADVAVGGIAAGRKPAAQEPVAPEPAAPELAVPEPAAPEPAAPEPAVPEPAAPEPAVPEPAAPEPAAPEPVVPEPAAQELLAAEPAAVGPAGADTGPAAEPAGATADETAAAAEPAAEQAGASGAEDAPDRGNTADEADDRDAGDGADGGGAGSSADFVPGFGQRDRGAAAAEQPHRRKRRRQWWITTASGGTVAVAALAALALAVWPGSGTASGHSLAVVPGHGLWAPGRPLAASSHEEAAGAPDAVGARRGVPPHHAAGRQGRPAPTARSNGATGPLTAGYTRYRDPSGFSIGIPAGWQVSHRGRQVYIRDPRGSRFLVIGQTSHPKPSPLADWRQQEAARSNSYPGYHRIRLRAVRYPQAQHAADWEFTYYDNGQLTRVLNRSFLVSARQAYTLSWSTPASAWHASYHYFRAFASTFRPAGARQPG